MKRKMLGFALGSPYPRNLTLDIGLLVIRVAVGLALCTVFEKFLPKDGRWGPQDWFIEDVAEMGFPLPVFFAWCAVLSEFVGGILLVVGLAARPAALLNAITTFTAAFIYHEGDVSGAGLTATLVFAVTLGLTFTGPGRLSLDFPVGRKLLRASTSDSR